MCKLQDRVCYRDEVHEQQRLVLSLDPICVILQCVEIIQKTKSRVISYTYEGPEIFQEWERREFEKYLSNNEEGVDFKPYKFRSLKEINTQGMVMPRSRILANINFASMTMSQLKVTLQKQQYSSMDIDTLDQEQIRSYKNNERVCKCGTKRAVMDGDGRKKYVHVGFKKRSRCKKCKGCLRPRCGQCTNCLNPRNKQACVEKVCLFPVIPKCPCFD